MNSVAKQYHTEVYQGRTHVIPSNDSLDHAISEECNCHPRIDNRADVGVFVFHQLIQEVSNE